MGYKFDHESASSAGQGGFITESGNYVGIIRDAVEKIMQTGSKFFNIKFESDEGLRSDYISICTGKRDGTPAFGAGHVSALLGLLKINGIDGVQIKEGIRYTELIDRRIGIGLQKEEFTKDDGTESFRMNLTHFFHPETKKTYSETAKNEPAKVWNRPVVDKVKTEPNKEIPQKDSLPF